LNVSCTSFSVVSLKIRLVNLPAYTFVLPYDSVFPP
jgi:hypothetical protein